jgi:electron transport complex protein RnfG
MMTPVTARTAPLALLVVVLAAGAAAIVTDRWLQPTRDAVRGEAVRAMLSAVPMPSYDNDPVESATSIMRQVGAIYIEQVYRARRGGDPVGAWMVVRVQGYSSEVRLLIGVRRGGMVTGVHVLSQHETSGYGDRIAGRDARWLDVFEGRSLGDPLRRLWNVGSEGGAFDAVSGATITSRSVVHAVRDALAWYFANMAAVSQPVPAAPAH